MDRGLKQGDKGCTSSSDLVLNPFIQEEEREKLRLMPPDGRLGLGPPSCSSLTPMQEALSPASLSPWPEITQMTVVKPGFESTQTCPALHSSPAPGYPGN